METRFWRGICGLVVVGRGEAVNARGGGAYEEAGEGKEEKVEEERAVEHVGIGAEKGSRRMIALYSLIGWLGI